MSALLDGQSGAVISGCGRYRYALWRRWDTERGVLGFIGLNPSTADASSDDPTLRRCVGFARDLGYGSVLVGNLFALRSAYPAALRIASDPVGPDNDGWLQVIAGKSDRLVAAWGNGGALNARPETVRALLSNVYCLGSNANGSPRHPLYVPAAAELRPYTLYVSEGARIDDHNAA